MSQTIEALRCRIEDKTAVLGVVGLGVVGLPVACRFAEVGFCVVGVDIKSARVESINAGLAPIEGDEPDLSALLKRVVESGRLRATSSYDDLRGADIVLIDVETPVEADHRPRYDALRAAARGLTRVLQAGSLVIVESTVAPGTMDRVVRPILQEAGVDFLLGHCPERVMPGKLLLNLATMSRVCGGSTPEIAALMQCLYRRIVQADLDVADCVTAELVKTTENAYRDINIAFANEVALICEAVGADVWAVRELVNKSPGRDMLLPGAGVGGHCIPKDPWLLAHGAGAGIETRLIPSARQVNDGMPLHVFKLLAAALRAHGLPVGGSRIGVLGYSYLENSGDIRNSPSQVLVARLREVGAEVVIHDPWVPEYRGDVMKRLEGCDAAVVMVGHQEYRRLDLAVLAGVLGTRILIDGRHIFDPVRARLAQLTYLCIGQGNCLA